MVKVTVTDKQQTVTKRKNTQQIFCVCLRLPYAGIFGGVCAISREHFELLNGFSNMFFGWGGEDDDMYNRISHHNLKVVRYPSEIARYTMLLHRKDKPSPYR